MSNKRNTYMKRFKAYMRRTYLTKLLVLVLVAIGVLATWLTDGDATFLVFVLMLFGPMFVLDVK